MVGTYNRRANWFLVIAGIVLIVCGIAALIAPWLFLEFLTVWAGIGFLISGVAGVVSYLQGRRVRESAGLSLFMAVLDIVVGLLLVFNPFAFSAVIPWLLGVAFIAFGALEVVGTFPFARLIPESRTIMVIAGILTVVIGIMFIVWPSSLSIWVAAFALVRGITLVAVGFTARI